MTSDEGPEGEVNQHDEADNTPGWGLPSTGPKSVTPPGTTEDDVAPLTEVQREVVDEVSEAQRELGTEERWRKASRRDLLGGGFGGGMFAGEIDSALASQAERRATASEREAQLLIGTSDAESDAEPHVPAGGPPTREEVYEAEMHPWPHHGMAETIEHNRELREAPGDSGPQSGSSDAQAQP
jgi:hypothetical protein